MEEEIDNVLRAVCKATGFTVRELKGRNRKQHLVAARQIAMIMLEDMGLKDKVISRIMRRDRVTVMYHRRKARELLSFGDSILVAMQIKVEKLLQKRL